MNDTKTIPPLADFLRWMSEIPSEFWNEPQGFPKGTISVRAVVADLWESLYQTRPPQNFLRVFDVPAKKTAQTRNRFRWTLLSCHLLWHPALQNSSLDQKQSKQLFIEILPALASVVPVENVLTEEERREEIIRRVLQVFSLQLPGENSKESQDRLTQIDSIEQQRILREAAAKEKHARQLRKEALRKKAQQEAASKAMRE